MTEIGLARILEKEAEYQRVFHSSPYLSPERAQGQKADVRSDIFALGVILYELALLLAESEFGLSSKEYRGASAPSREAAFRKFERAAHQRFLAEDWAGAAAAYRELMGRSEAEQKAALLLAVEYCERLAGAQASGSMPDSRTRRQGADLEPNDSSISRRHPA